MELVSRAAELYGNAPALIIKGTTLSFEACNHRATGIAGKLYQMGLHAGDIVAIISPNTPEMVLLLLGLLKAGIIAAPLNYRFPETLQKKALEKLRPRLLLTATPASTPLPGIRTESVARFLDEASHATQHEAFEAPESMERPVTIIHTSASSGEPKAAVHSFANHWYNALGSNENLPFGPGECWLLSLPLYHIGGYAILFKSLLSGAAIAVGEPNESIEEALEHFPITHLSLVPTQLYRLLAKPESALCLASLKALLLGGSPAPKAVIQDALRHKIPIYLSYGSTEMGSQIATTPGPIKSAVQESGRTLPYREMMVAEDGELLVKGPCLFMGYLQSGTVQPQTDKDGWFHTSDIGQISENGEVTIIGRKDNMFISGGENIHPEEIEGALMMIDGVGEALVVPHRDPEYGQRPIAFIKTVEENKPDDEAITQAMNRLVGKLKSPIRYFRIEEWKCLPGSQKTDRAWYQRVALTPDGPFA